jgi:hypothetical protein
VRLMPSIAIDPSARRAPRVPRIRTVSVAPPSGECRRRRPVRPRPRAPCRGGRPAAPPRSPAAPG